MWTLDFDALFDVDLKGPLQEQARLEFQLQKQLSFE